MIKLHGIPVSRGSGCLWMLDELGVGYEERETNFVGDAPNDFPEPNPGLAFDQSGRGLGQRHVFRSAAAPGWATAGRAGGVEAVLEQGARLV